MPEWLGLLILCWVLLSGPIAFVVSQFLRACSEAREAFDRKYHSS